MLVRIKKQTSKVGLGVIGVSHFKNRLITFKHALSYSHVVPGNAVMSCPITCAPALVDTHQTHMTFESWSNSRGPLGHFEHSPARVALFLH